MSRSAAARSPPSPPVGTDQHETVHETGCFTEPPGRNPGGSLSDVRLTPPRRRVLPFFALGSAEIGSRRRCNVWGGEVMVVCYPEVFPRSKSLGCCQRRAPRSVLEAWNDAHDRLLANPQSGEQVHWRDLRVMTPGEHPLAVSEPVRRCLTARRTASRARIMTARSHPYLFFLTPEVRHV